MMTKLFSVTAVIPSISKKWKMKGNVASVENCRVFMTIEKFHPSLGMVAYTHGKFSEEHINWLGLLYGNGASITHFGDYDPVGMQEYLRIKKRMPGATLWIPDNIAYLMDKYGKKKLVEKSAGALKNLRGIDDKDVRRIVYLMDKYGCGLEHEILIKVT